MSNTDSGGKGLIRCKRGGSAKRRREMEPKELRRIQKCGVTYHGKRYFFADMAKHLGCVAEVVIDPEEPGKLKCFVGGKFICEAEQGKLERHMAKFSTGKKGAGNEHRGNGS
jgi:hypothetical protein